MNMSRFFLGLFGIGIAIFFYVDAIGYPDQAAQMPLIYSVAVALLSSAMVAQELIGISRRKTRPVRVEEGQSAIQSEEEGGEKPKRILTVFLIFAMAIAYVSVITTVGYLLATAAFMLASLWLIRTVSLTFTLIGIAALVAVICFVFIGFLGLPIPLLPTFDFLHA